MAGERQSELPEEIKKGDRSKTGKNATTHRRGRKRSLVEKSGVPLAPYQFECSGKSPPGSLPCA